MDSRRGSVIDRNLAILLLASLLFGVMAFAVRFATKEVHPTQCTFFRFSGSFALLLLVGGTKGLRPKPGNLHRVLFRGIIGAAAISLYFVAIQRAGAALATLLQNTYPVFGAVFGAAFLGEGFSRRLRWSLVLDLAGIALLVGPGIHWEGADPAGLWIALAAAMVSGGAIVTARHLRKTEEATLITTYFMGVGAALTLPSLAWPLPTYSRTLATAVGVVILTSVVAQWLLHHALGYVSATQAGIISGTSVVTATALESFWFGASFQPRALLGALLLLCAVGLASGSPSHPGEPSPADHEQHATNRRHRSEPS